jgi:hypothetical protein
MAEHLTVTPSGFEILFEDGLEDPQTGQKKKRQYTVNGQKLPAVSTIVGTLDKSEPLKHWAERLAVEGCIELAKSGWLPQDPQTALGRLYDEGLRHFQVSEQKAKRGSLTHEDLVAFGRGEAPRPYSEIPVEDRGFARGVASWFADFRPAVIESEQMVASVELGFAGRPDMTCTLGIKTLPDGSPAPTGLGLVDLKSHEKFPRTKPSQTYPEGNLKTPYAENHFQLGLYEVARRESGYPPSDWRAVVRVDAEGNYDFCLSWLEPESALTILPLFHAFKTVGPRVKRPEDTLAVERVAA